jgi:hypothetical protein
MGSPVQARARKKRRGLARPLFAKALVHWERKASREPTARALPGVIATAQTAPLA